MSWQHAVEEPPSSRPHTLVQPPKISSYRLAELASALPMQEHRHSFVCTYRLNDFISAVPQVLRDWHSHQNVILYNKDRFLNCGRIGHME